MIAGHKGVRAAAIVATLGWMATIGWYLVFSDGERNWGYSVIALFQCVALWEMSRRWVVALPLFALNALAILVYLAATIGDVNFWWTAFVINRLFELSIAYLLVSSAYRIRRMQMT